MTQIELIQVEDSSNIKAIGYDPRTQTLVVHFRDSVYNYHDVPFEVWEEFRDASSKGKYHSRNIRSNRDYTYERVS